MSPKCSQSFHPLQHTANSYSKDFSSDSDSVPWCAPSQLSIPSAFLVTFEKLILPIKSSRSGITVYSQHFYSLCFVVDYYITFLTYLGKVCIFFFRVWCLGTLVFGSSSTSVFPRDFPGSLDSYSHSEQK